MLEFLLNNVLCCPYCSFPRLVEDELHFSCQACNWSGSPIGGDTPNFAPIVYERGQTKTRRVSRRSFLLKDHLWRLKVFHHKLVPWRRWIFRDTKYWEIAITPLREQELVAVKDLFNKIGYESQGTLLELGVGRQDHKELYQHLARYAICSDIYRDPAAVEVYKDVSWIFYCLINIEYLPFCESSIDILLTSHVVEHFPDRVKNLQALHRVLKPGAIACHVVPIATGFIFGHLISTGANFLTLLPRIGRGIHGEYDSVWQEVRETRVSAWRQLFEKCGFELLYDAPGTLGLRPVPPTLSLWTAKHLHLYGSWIFMMRTIK